MENKGLIDLLLAKQNAMKQRALYLCRNDMCEAEDLLNDANIKLIAMIQKGQLDENSFGEYFFLTINSIFIDKIRKRKVNTVEFKSEYNYINHVQNPEVALEKKSINFSELMDLANISPTNRQAFEQFISGQNIYKFCEDSNINASTFRGQIRRVKESLHKYRDLFKDYDFDLIIENVVVGKKIRRKKNYLSESYTCEYCGEKFNSLQLFDEHQWNNKSCS